jgi:hypothetical protein
VAAPQDEQAASAGGLRETDKNGALAATALDPGRCFAVSIGPVLEGLARRGLIPVGAGLSPMEGADLVRADLVHTEAQC